MQAPTSFEYLRAWVVTVQPRDYSPRYVATLWIISQSGKRATKTNLGSDCLLTLRSEIPDGLTVHPRSSKDPKEVIETWL